MKVDGSLVDRYKKKVENHKVVAFIIAATFLLTSLTAAMKGLESFIDTAIQGTESLAKLFSTELAGENTQPIEQQQTTEERAAHLAQQGCILFLPNSSEPVIEPEIIMNAYIDFWRKNNIFHAKHVVIQGFVHANMGSPEYAVALAEKNALNAQILLQNKARVSVNRTKFTTVSYGKELPLIQVDEYECGAKVYVL